MDDRAQLFTLDLLLALVPLALAMAISANAISGLAFQVQDYAATYFLHRNAEDAIDILVKTSGVPRDWEDSGNISIIGLAAWDSTANRSIPNFIDISKFYRIDVTALADLLGTNNFNLTLVLANISSVNASVYNQLNLSVGSAVPANATEIVSMERLLISDSLLDIKSSSNFALSINNSGQGGGASRLCALSEFSLTTADIANTNYWIYLNYSRSDGQGGPPTFGLSVNEDDVADASCESSPGRPGDNSLLEPSDFSANNPPFGMSSLPDYNYEVKDSAGWTNVSDQNITYYVQNTSTGYVIYMILPKPWLKVGLQEFYLWVSGFTTVSTGWYATAPPFVTVSLLEQYFNSKIVFDDVPTKFVLRVWK